MKLRDYQEKAVSAVLESWKTNKTCLVVLPTGCGKTVVFGEVIRRFLGSEVAGAENAPATENLEQTTKHAMVLAHREELINQAADKIMKMAKVTCDVEMGDREATSLFGEWRPVIVSSVQTQCTGRMRKFLPEDFGLLVIDEAHHATSPTYRACIDHYMKNPSCRLLGVTATPDRADKLAMGNVFSTVAFDYSVTQAIDDGWLVPVKQKFVSVGSLDYSKVSTKAGDFNAAELAEVLEEERNLHGIASPTIQICGKKRAIVFAASVRQAERLAEIINRTCQGKAKWLCGKTPKEERHKILEDFRNGTVQFMVNVGVLTEGFDDAGVEVVVMARPTKSRSLYAQMAGRATRPAADIAAKLGDVDNAAKRRDMIQASIKPSCLVIDFVGNSGRHKLVTSLDILDGKAINPDMEEAMKLAKERCANSPDGEDVRKVLADALAEIKERKLATENQRKFIKLAAKFTVKSVDPFDTYDLSPMQSSVKSTVDNKKLSISQCGVIRDYIGLDPEKMEYSYGKALIDSHFKRIDRGLATLKQTKFLRKRGYLMPMTKKEAMATISRLIANANYTGTCYVRHYRH